MFRELLAKRLLPAPLITGAVCVTMHLTNHSKGLSGVLDSDGLGARPKIEEDPLVLAVPPTPPAPSAPQADNTESADSTGESANGQDTSDSTDSEPQTDSNTSSDGQDSSASSTPTSPRAASTTSASKTNPWEALKFLVTDINLNSKS